jgi:hypothetical protein
MSCAVFSLLAGSSAAASSGSVSLNPRGSGTVSLFKVLDSGATCKAIGATISGELPKLSVRDIGEESKVDWTGPAGRKFGLGYLPWRVRGTATPNSVAAVGAAFTSGKSPGRIWVSRVSKWGDDRLGPVSSPLERHINFSFQKNGGTKSSRIWGSYTTVGDVYVLACAYEVDHGALHLGRELGGVLRSRGDHFTGFSALVGDDLHEETEYVLAVAAWVEPASSYVTSKMANTGTLSVQLVMNHGGH